MVLPASFRTVKFTDIDTNGSAYISFGEFRAAVKKHDENACDNAIFDLFKKYCDSANEANKVKPDRSRQTSVLIGIKKFFISNFRHIDDIVHKTKQTQPKINKFTLYFYSSWQKLPVYFPTRFQEGGDITYSASYDKSMINQKEYYNMLAKEFPKPPEVKFEDVDANGSGFISKQEFLNFALKVNSEDEEPLCVELLTAQVVAVFDEFSNQINDGKGNEGTVYSEGYDKVITFHYEFSSY